MKRLKWVRPETFTELKLPQRIFAMHDHLENLKRNWRNRELRKEKFPHLYRSCFAEKTQVMYRINRKGEVEWLVCLENETQMMVLGAYGYYSAEVLRTEPCCFTLALCFWDEEDEMPSYLALEFDITDEYDRYAAAAFIEQEQLPLFVLWKEGEQLYLSKCEMYGWTEEMREDMRKAILETYRGWEDETAGEEGEEEETDGEGEAKADQR